MVNLMTGKFSLRKKLIMLYLLAAVVPILLITIMISWVYYRSILENAYSLVEQNNQANEILVEERMDACRQMLYEVVTDASYIQMAEKINTDEENTVLTAENLMKEMMQNSIYTSQDVSSIAFLSDSSRCVSYSKLYGSLYDSVWSDEAYREDIRQQIESADGMAYLAPVDLRADDLGTDYVILMGFPVKNLHTKEQYGVFVFALDSSMLMLGGSTEDWDTDTVTTIIVDENNTILASEDQEYINHTLDEFREQNYSKSEHLLLQECGIKDTEWRILSLIRRSAYRQKIISTLSTVILLILVITVLFCVIVIYYTNGYIRTIRKIAEGIKSYPGSLDQEFDLAMDEQDELYQIVRQFRRMTVRIKSLITELQQKNQDIQEASTRQKHAEIKALEAQINPHFLFNTLDSINWRAIENDEEEISNMLGMLGSLLRYSVSNIDMVVLMKAEIDWLQKYIYLQRDRFNYSFDCQYELSEEVLNFPIYKMLLQPIIENAILHAFEQTKSGGMIYFKAEILEDGRMRISIRDNGSGMSSDRLEQIRQEIHDKSALNSKSIGISNIINRLWIYYRDEAEIYVNSTLGEGSEFILVIPNIGNQQFNE